MSLTLTLSLTLSPTLTLTLTLTPGATLVSRDYPYPLPAYLAVGRVVLPSSRVVAVVVVEQWLTRGDTFKH